MGFLPLPGAECRAGKEGNFAPNGAKREARYSGAALRAHAVVSPFNLSLFSSFDLFCKAKEIKRNPFYMTHLFFNGFSGAGL